MTSYTSERPNVSVVHITSVFRVDIKAKEESSKLNWACLLLPVVSCLVHFSILKMETLWSSEPSGCLSYNHEDCTLQSVRTSNIILVFMLTSKIKYLRIPRNLLACNTHIIAFEHFKNIFCAAVGVYQRKKWYSEFHVDSLICRQDCIFT